MEHSLFGLGRVEILKTHFTSFEMRSLRLAFPFQILIHILPLTWQCLSYSAAAGQYIVGVMNNGFQLSGKRYDFP